MDDDGDVDLENINNSQETVWKWYIIRQENTLPQLWSFITNTLTVYALFATPLVLIFSQLSEYLRSFELFVDVCFTLDIVLNFFKLSANQKESEMKTYRLQYLRGLFIDIRQHKSHKTNLLLVANSTVLGNFELHKGGGGPRF